MFADLRSATRTLARAPGFSLLAIAVLALGIGSSTTMFSAVGKLLFDSVPYPDPARLVLLSTRAADGSGQAVAFGSYRELLARSRSFEAMAVMRPWQPALSGASEPERLSGQRVSASYFQVLGVVPATGSGFNASHDQPGGPATAVISHSLWQRRLDGDPGVLGRELMLDERPHTVVGIMPAGFKPVLEASAEIWTLLQYDPALPVDGREWGHHLRAVARLQPGLAVDDADAEINRIASAPIAEYSRPAHATLERGVIVTSLQEELTRAVRPGLLSALVGVLLLLLIACVNVANLLLVRGAQRSGEFEMRAALGAGPGRLVRQLLTENLLLGVSGALLGLVFAHVSLRALVAFAPPGLPGIDDLGVDRLALAFAAASACGIGLLVGLAPALRAARLQRSSSSQSVTRRVIGTQRRTRHALVAAELALAVVLLTSAGLLAGSLQRLYAVDAGFDPSGLLTMQVHASGERFDRDPAATQRFFDAVLERVRRVPGVQSAALTSQLPLSGDLDEYGVRFEPLPDDASQDAYNAARYAVSPDYFATMAIPLLAGRALEAGDREAGDSRDAPRAALLGASLAKARFGARSPIGQRLHIGPPDSPWFTVVGVVGDVRQASLATGPANAIYIAQPQWHFTDQTLSLVVRSQGDPAPLAAAIRDAIWAVDKDRPITRVATMETLLESSAAERRFASMLFAAFGLAALGLAAIGIYGALAVDVAERRNEIGLRVALGASRSAVLRWALTQSATVIAVGVGIGLLIASVATRALRSLLFDITSTDPTVYAAAASLLAGVALVACLLPLRQALKIDPAQALRSQ